MVVRGSDRGAERVPVMVTHIMTARLDEIDPHAWQLAVVTVFHLRHRAETLKMDLKGGAF